LKWYQQGVQLYCAPTVDGRESWSSTMRHIAQEGRCFVLAAAQFSQQKVSIKSTCAQSPGC
jgi:predicted amidohydrolase